MKFEERLLAVNLRKQGKSYREILSRVPVAKSTLSLWLRDVGMAKQHRQKLTEQRKAAALRGAHSRHAHKERVSREIKDSSRAQVGSLNAREKWLLGIALYWAEGTKEKTYKPGVGLIFNNSDPKMVALYVQWLEESLSVQRSDIKFSLYIHKTKLSSIEDIRNYWAKCLGVEITCIERVYIKRGPTNTKRKNTGSLYYGTLRVTVSKSSVLNRRVAGWIEGVVGSVGK